MEDCAVLKHTDIVDLKYMLIALIPSFSTSIFRKFGCIQVIELVERL